MKIFIEKEYYYTSCKEADSTNYYKNNINSVADVYTLLKESFKDILQELLEAKMDASLGYVKNQKDNIAIDNKKTDIPERPPKASMGNSRLMYPGTAMGSLNKSSSPNTSGIS